MTAFITPLQAILLATTPYAYWVASLVGAANLKAARKTPVAPKPEEVKAEQKPRKLKKTVFIGGFILLYLAVFFGVQAAFARLSAGVMDKALNGLVTFTFVSMSGPVLLDLVGQIDTSFARFHDGPLIAHFSLSWPKKFALALLVGAVFHYMPQTESVGHYVVVALASVAFPIGIAKVPAQKAVSLRRVLGGMMGTPIFVMCVVAVFAVIDASGVIPEDSFDSLDKLIEGDEETRTKPEDHDWRSIRSLYVFQALFFCAVNGPVVSILYRADQHLAKLKTDGAIVLTEDADDEDEVALLEPLPSLKTCAGTKGPSGGRMPVPSTHTLVKRHFVAAHRGLFTSVSYAKVACVAALVALGPLASGFRFAFGVDSIEIEDVNITDVFALLPAIILFPWVASIAVSALALFRGEFKQLYDYREDWTAIASASEEATPDEKAALIEA